MPKPFQQLFSPIFSVRKLLVVNCFFCQMILIQWIFSVCSFKYHYCHWKLPTFKWRQCHYNLFSDTPYRFVCVCMIIFKNLTCPFQASDGSRGATTPFSETSSLFRNANDSSQRVNGIDPPSPIHDQVGQYSLFQSKWNVPLTVGNTGMLYMCIAREFT